jgi:PKD repeat protein
MIPYLIEPHNPWDNTPKKKKHLCQQIEEDALMARIIAEQLAAQAAAQQVQNQAMAPAGGGGIPPYEYFNQSEVVDFSGTPTTAPGPLTVTFTNLTTTQAGDEYKWIFGDGNTSTLANPTHLYANTGSFTVTLESTQSALSQTSSVVKVAYISASSPVVVANFLATSASNIGPVTVTFGNTSTDDSQTPTTVYNWTFGDGQSSSANLPPIHTYANTGSYSLKLGVTGSYSQSAKVISVVTVAPTFGITTFVTTNSVVAPSFVTLSSSLNYNGHGTASGLWFTGEWVGTQEFVLNYYSTDPVYATNTSTYGTRSNAGIGDGKFTASLSITESSYNLTASHTVYFPITVPTVSVSFTYNTASGLGVTADGFTASFTASTSWLSSSWTPGTLTGRWDFGDSFWLPYSDDQPFTRIYSTGSFTASLSITESNYKIVSNLYTASFSHSAP